MGGALAVTLATYRAGDASLDAAAPGQPANALGVAGADIADLAIQTLGVGAWAIALILIIVGVSRLAKGGEAPKRAHRRVRAAAGLLGVVALSGAAAAATPPAAWPLSAGLGGVTGDSLLALASGPLALLNLPSPTLICAALLGLISFAALASTVSLGQARAARPSDAKAKPRRPAPLVRADPPHGREALAPEAESHLAPAQEGATESLLAIKTPKGGARPSGREEREIQPGLPFAEASGGFRLPELAMLAKPKPRAAAVRRRRAAPERPAAGERAGRVRRHAARSTRSAPARWSPSTNWCPRAGVKSARVVALSDDIARSMSVAACRVSVVPGRNAIGIELPNAQRETVYLRDLLSSRRIREGRARPCPWRWARPSAASPTSPTWPRCPTC